MRIIIALLVTLIATSLSLAEESVFPGCTPEAETPQAILDYFQKYDKPIPETYCQHVAVPPIEEETPPLPDRAPTVDELPPQAEPDMDEPEEEMAPDPEWAPERHPLPPPVWPRRNGELEIDVPGFHLELHFEKRKRRR